MKSWCVIAAWLECLPEKSSWCRNEQVCQGLKGVKRFEWSNGLDIAPYKNIPLPSFSFARSTIEQLFTEQADERLQDLRADPSATNKLAEFERRLLSAENTKPLSPPRNSVAFIKGILFTFISLGVSRRSS